jgi:hypothetical protein
MERDLKTLRIHLLATEFADKVWDIVSQWDYHAKKTVGEHWTRAADSIGANIAEGYGRFHFAEKLNFFITRVVLNLKASIGWRRRRDAN